MPSALIKAIYDPIKPNAFTALVCALTFVLLIVIPIVVLINLLARGKIGSGYAADDHDAVYRAYKDI